MEHFWWNRRKSSQASRVVRSGSRSEGNRLGTRVDSFGSRLSSQTGSHCSSGSRGAGRGKELEFQFFIRQTETLYPPWWTHERAVAWFRDLPDDTLWNCYICALVLLGLVWTVAHLQNMYIDIIDVIYNVSYAIHIFAIGYRMLSERESTDITCWIARSLNDYNLKGSILGTTLKYCYIFMVMRITWAYVWLHVEVIEPSYYIVQSNSTNTTANDSNQTNTTTIRLNTIGGDSGNPAGEFLTAVYTISKMFIPIGPSSHPDNDIKRIFCLMIMVSGCLVVTGAAVASLSLIISLYMRPEETFRSRYRLIMKEMTDTKVPPALREKVESFYKMYWHKQRAVSKTRLLPTFPPTLPATINLDIYFEATQKTRILRDLPHQMLSELAKKMMTIHYIPGDAIIKRGSKKCRIIYITYGDVEMLTAEDDTTAILRLTRGTILTPCGGAVAEALTSSHLAVRAATFCTAHVLKASEMWIIVCKYSVAQDHAGPILASFTVQHKSSILQFNRNLIALKTMKDSQGVPLLASPDIFLEIAGCYIMRNAHPYHLIFKSAVSMEFRFFDFAMTIVYVLDHIVYLSTGANVEEGVPITFAQTSSKQMRSHWFVLNVVATLPIFEFVGDGHFAGINKLLSLPKLFRVLKCLEESSGYRSNVLRFLSYSLLLLIACYLIAAIQQGFMCFQANYCLVTNFTHSPFWEEKPLDDETISSRLIFGLYWAISMINFTNHRQTWAATEWKHVIYTLFILEICIVLRIFMEAVYSATIMVTTAPRENYSARIETVKSFLVRNEVDPQLRKRFITYLELCWYTDKAYKMTHKKHSNIFYDLPPHVFQDIVGKHRIKYLHAIPFMKIVNKEDLKVVTASVKMFYTSPNEILLHTGELTNEIYIIKSGICEEFQRLQTPIPSFVKYVPPPPTANLMHFRLPRKHQPDTEFLAPFDRLGFLSILRYVFPRYTIRPDGTYLVRYEWFRFFCAFLSAQLFPAYTYLVLQWPYLYFVTLFLDLAAFYDIFQRMLIGYFNENGILVYHPSSTASYYIKGAFIVDLIGCLPLENLESPRREFLGDKFRVTPTTQFLMLNRLIQLYRMPGAMKVLKDYIGRRDIVMVVHLIPIFSAMLNFLTCFMVFHSVRIYYKEFDRGNSYEWLLLPLEDHGGSWIYLFQDKFRFNLTETPWNLHLGTYFWVVYECTSTGYGIFNPSNQNIMRVLFIGMTSSAMIITYYSVRIISVRANVNKSLAGFQQHMKDINAYMFREKLNTELQKEVRRYYGYNWEKMGGIDYRGVLKLCDQITLRTDAILHIYGPTFAKCPILVDADISLLRILGRAVRSVYFLRGMKILEMDDVTPELYFVDHGGVEIRVPMGDTNSLLRLPRGSIFGNLDNTPYRRSPYNVVATSRLHLLMIKSAAFANITKDFPVVRELMEKFRVKRHNNRIEKKMYILGGEATIQVKRHLNTDFPPRTKTSFLKYIYFQEGAVVYYLLFICMGCIYLDLYNAGYEVTVYKSLRRRKESITANLTLTTLVAVSIWFTLFVHTTTCIWYFMAVVEDQLEPGSSWIHLDDGTTHCDNHYICSLYFVLTTFTQNGVGDIMPKKRSEVVFVAILQIVSTMMFMIYVGELSNIIQYQSYRSFNFYSKYLELQMFLKNNRVSKNLVTIANKYTLHLWRENRGLQIPHFLAQAPLSLRLRVMSAAYLHHITRHHIFEDCEPAFLRQVVGCLKLYTYNEGTYIKHSENYIELTL
ncbi:unnamed protein product [Spodoptera exigua]|nr:unnamed protein product [Spodoptera exigua]